MDELLQKRFDRVEGALTTLVESITSYNPNVQAAHDLVAADDELAEGLELLSKHQDNNARILALRAEADALEAQLKSSISTLAALRQELLDMPISTAPKDSRPVSSNLLLWYAQHISEYTVPPTFREKVPKAEGDADKEKDNAGAASQNADTPAVPAAGGDNAQAETAEGEEKKDITANQAEWLKLMRERGWRWTPWPDEATIRNGNLGRIQKLLEQDKDPWTIDVSKDDENLPESVQQAAQQEQQPAAQGPTVADQQQQQQQQEPPRRESVPQPREAQQVFTGFEFEEEDDDSEDDGVYQGEVRDRSVSEADDDKGDFRKDEVQDDGGNVRENEVPENEAHTDTSRENEIPQETPARRSSLTLTFRRADRLRSEVDEEAWEAMQNIPDDGNLDTTPGSDADASSVVEADADADADDLGAAF